MEKFIAYKKLSKKKQRELAAKKRGSWGGLNPVTRKPANPKAYNRKKAGQWRDDSLRDLPFDYNRVYLTGYFIFSGLRKGRLPKQHSMNQGKIKKI